MWYDNQVLNINGHETDSHASGLLLAIKMAFLQQGGDGTTCCGWTESKKHGLVLYWTKARIDEMNMFMSPLTPEEVLPNVTAWLANNSPEDFDLEQWDGNCDHDGSNSLGWRVYREDWGHAGDTYAGICSIKPIWVWHGK